MNEVCKDVQKEPDFLPLAGERINTSANTSNKARLNIRVRDPWIPYLEAFFDIRVFYPYAERYRSQNVDKMLQTTEKEKRIHATNACYK